MQIGWAQKKSHFSCNDGYGEYIKSFFIRPINYVLMDTFRNWR